jgi:putative addiction module killer protein
MRYEITSTNIFDKWLSRIKDRQAVKAILQRLARIEAGNLGDVEPVGSQVSEMRIFTGKGYRIYFTTQNNRVIVLLCGGTKSSKKQQQQDIWQAKTIFGLLEN